VAGRRRSAAIEQPAIAVKNSLSHDPTPNHRFRRTLGILRAGEPAPIAENGVTRTCKSDTMRDSTDSPFDHTT
jgi:hypothetical protein